LNIIDDGAVLIDSGTIAEVGRSQDMLEKYPHVERWDARGGVIMPGLVDPHTHAVWAGDRAVEFEMRVAGKTYQEIMRAGGGIVSTVRETRRASAKELREQTRQRLDSVLAHGTTTLESKTGYGLDTETELRMLQVLLDLDREHPLDLVMTFLGAHAVPPEYAGRTEAYTDVVCEEMIPALAAWWPEHSDRPLPFVDVFCERGVFDYQQSRRILETARGWGFPLKIHADEFENLGGAALAAELGAASADHLVVTSAEDIQTLAGSDTAAVALPCTPFGLGEPEYTPADDLLEAGGLLAIATDLNPGTAWCENMQFAIALACRYMKLTPAQAIAAATINAAAAIGQADRVGSLEVGKQGDVLILAVEDYRHLGYRFGSNLAAAVIKKGRLVWQKEEK
jgi:imidazolonepropionase